MSLVSRINDQLGGIRRHLLDHLAEVEIERRQSQSNLRRFPERRQIA